MGEGGEDSTKVVQRISHNSSILKHEGLLRSASSVFFVHIFSHADIVARGQIKRKEWNRPRFDLCWQCLIFIDFNDLYWFLLILMILYWFFIDFLLKSTSIWSALTMLHERDGHDVASGLNCKENKIVNFQ